MRTFLLILGPLSALLIIGQLVMGQLILRGEAPYVKIHQHSGYMTVVFSLVYILLSLFTIYSKPKKAQ